MKHPDHNDREWKVVCELTNAVQAELVRGLLESQGILVLVSQEGAGRAIGLTVGTLGLVQVLVPGRQYQQAKDLVDQYFQDADLDS